MNFTLTPQAVKAITLQGDPDTIAALKAIANKNASQQDKHKLARFIALRPGIQSLCKIENK